MYSMSIIIIKELNMVIVGGRSPQRARLFKITSKLIEYFCYNIGKIVKDCT